MISAIKTVTFVFLVLGLVGCSDSEQTNSINGLYRESDGFRAELAELGCRVGNQQTMGGKTAVTCQEGGDHDLLLERASVLKEWSKVLTQIEQHPDLPGESHRSYVRLRGIILDYANQMESLVMGEREVEREYISRVTANYTQWSEEVLALQGSLVELGCDLLADPKPADFAQTCNLEHALEKIEILEGLQIQQASSQQVIDESKGMSFEEEARDLALYLSELVLALSKHLKDSLSEASYNANILHGDLRFDYGVGFRFVGTANGPIEITLPEDKRNEEGLKGLIKMMKDYIAAVEILSDYAELITSTGTLDMHKRRREAAIAFLNQNLTIEFIIEKYEPEPTPSPVLDEDPHDTPREVRPGDGIFASVWGSPFLS